MAMTEDEVRQLLKAVPDERRIQARAAVTGSVSDLLYRVREVSVMPAGGWQATLSTLYMIEFAALHRTTSEVATMASELLGDCRAPVVLDAAAGRAACELAAIAAQLYGSVAASDAGAEKLAHLGASLTASFLDSVTTRRQPTDLAAMLTDARDNQLLMHEAVRRLCRSAPPPKVAQVVLCLRGTQATEPLAAILTEMLEAASPDLALFLTSLDRFAETESVDTVIRSVVTWNTPSSSALEAKGGIDSIAELVKSLLEEEQPHLAKRVVTSAIREFARSDQQYRLYALVFVFKQHGLDDAAEQIMNEISASARDKRVVEMIIKFCQREQPQQTVILLQVILENPKPGITAAAAVEFAKRLDQVRSDIFITAAKWAHENLSEFEQELRGTSNDWAEEFRDNVTAIASDREQGSDIGNIVLWLLADVDSKRGIRRADEVIARVVGRRRPDIMVALICKLRAGRGWWKLRESAALQIRKAYGIDDMVQLIAEAEGRCLPAILRLIPDWLTHHQRSDQDVVQLVRKFRDARGYSVELDAALVWSAAHFNRPDGTHPVAALEHAGLVYERNAWSKGGRRTWSRRPDPDPPQ
jgi:hypothetical protein